MLQYPPYKGYNGAMPRPSPTLPAPGARPGQWAFSTRRQIEDEGIGSNDPGAPDLVGRKPERVATGVYRWSSPRSRITRPAAAWLSSFVPDVPAWSGPRTRVSSPTGRRIVYGLGHLPADRARVPRLPKRRRPSTGTFASTFGGWMGREWIGLKASPSPDLRASRRISCGTMRIPRRGPLIADAIRPITLSGYVRGQLAPHAAREGGLRKGDGTCPSAEWFTGLMTGLIPKRIDGWTRRERMRSRHRSETT